MSDQQASPFQRSRFILGLAVLIVVISFFARLYYAPKFFVHIDDAGVPITVLASMSTESRAALIANKFADPNTPRAKLLKKMIEYKVLDPKGGGILRVLPIFVVASRWTYGPIQYIFMPWLVSPEYSFEKAVFLGRLPSLISTLVLVLLLAAVVLFWTGDFLAVLFGVVIVCCSLELFIYSIHASSYAAGAAAHAVLLMAVVHPGIRQRVVNSPIWVTAFLSFCLLLNYQSALLFPGWMLAIVLCDRSIAVGKTFSTLKNLVKGALLFSPLFLAAYFLRIKGTVPGDYAAGHDKEFLWASATALPNPLYWVKNGFLTVGAMVSPVPLEEYWLANLLIGCIITIAAIGFFETVFSADPLDRALAVFTVVSLLVFASFVVLQRLSLSPTRHWLILLPLPVIFAARAAKELRRAPLRIGLLMIIALICTSHLLTFPRFVDRRLELFSSASLETLFTAELIDTVVLKDLNWIRPLMKPIAIRPTVFLMGKSQGPPGICNMADAALSTYCSGVVTRGDAPRNRLAYLGRLAIETDEVSEAMKQVPQNDSTGTGHREWTYRLVRSEFIKDGPEVELSSATKNTGNTLALQVFERVEVTIPTK